MEPPAVSDADIDAVRRQLGREPRGLVAVAHRCRCSLPDVVATAPRLPDGTPFPTTFYLTCPRAAAAVGTLEADGVMREMNERLAGNPDVASNYSSAHSDYLRRRDALGLACGVGKVPEIEGTSAAGMPTRVKCLHALLAHALAAGPGVTVLGDDVRAAVGQWWGTGPCVAPASVEPAS